MISETTGRETVEIDGVATEITAYLSDAIRTPTGLVADRDILTGVVRSDIKDRFPDGLRIHTSFLTREVAPDVFLTRSGSIYRVESWRQ